MMEEKLKLLLDKIGLEKEYHSFFINGKLQKIYINEAKKEWNFLIEIDNTLPVKLYNHINELLSKTFDKLNIVYTTYIPKKINTELITEYYVNIINLLNKKTLKVFEDKHVFK